MVALESHSGSLKGFCGLGSGVRVWDVVSELVCLCTIPSPSNPFALDMRYIKNLPLPERFFVTGALLNFLETYVVYGNRDEMHYDKGRAPRSWVRSAHRHQRTSRRRCLAGSDLQEFLTILLLPVVEEVKPLRRLHVQSLLELQRLRMSSSLTVQEPSAEE